MCDLTIGCLRKPLVANYSMVKKYSVAATLGVDADARRQAGRPFPAHQPWEADKAYNAKDFVVAAEALNVTRTSRRTKRAAARTSMAGRPGTPGYGISLTCRWLVERASNPANHRLYLNRWL